MAESDVTQEEFDRALERLLDSMTGAQLLAIPGLYEVVSEALNNDVLERAKDWREEESSDRA